jgi:hypothetical protein
MTTLRYKRCWTPNI